MNLRESHQLELNELGATVHRDALSMMLGRKLGTGSTRRVYVNDLNTLQVLKMDMSADFANVTEWNYWQEFKDTELGKWLAPCDQISPGGEILIQRRTEQPKHYPLWIPAVFCDLKLTNFGVVIGSDQLVCHDYAMLQLDKLQPGTRLRYQKADWWRLDAG